MKVKKNIFRTMLSVSGIVILAKVLGFVKQMVTANAFGATIQTDLIYISEGLVANIDYLLIQTLATAFIPTYIHLKTTDLGKSKQFVSNVIKVFLLVTITISTAVLLLAPYIAKVLAPSYSVELSAQLSFYVRIFSPVLIVLVELAIFNSLLKANEIFVPGELVGVNQSIILILLVILIGRIIGPDTVVIAFYAYAVFNLLFLMVYSRKYWKVGRGNPFKDDNVHKMLVMMGPLLLGYSVVFVNQQVDKIIVSGLGEGTVTAMNYAAVLSNFVSTFIGSICGVLFTYITQNIAEKRDRAAADLTVTSALQIGTLLLPISVITVMNAKDIVTIVFGRGKFDDVAIHNCSMALIGYGLMFVPFVMRELFSRFQYAYGDSKRPMINSTLAILFNIVFSIILSRFMGVLGVTLATSISVLICGILNIISSRKKNRDINISSYIKLFPRWIIGIGVCISVSIIFQKVVSINHPIVRFILVTVVTLTVYGIAVWPIIKPLINKIMRKS